MYGATKNSSRLDDSRKLLDWIYKKVPSTKGCMENISKTGGCGGWCCEKQNPQVLYVEFLNTLDFLKKNWTTDDLISLVELSMRSYLFEKDRKGCIFWDKETKLCQQHNTRCYNCRIYGIIPDEEFKPRYERLKILYPDTKYQCNLVFTENGTVVTKKDTDRWWDLLKNAEKSIGINPEKINDDFGGSYRTYYEHILLEFIGEEGMILLSDMRQYGSDEQKEAIIKTSVQGLRKFKYDDKSKDTNVGI